MEIHVIENYQNLFLKKFPCFKNFPVHFIFTHSDFNNGYSTVPVLPDTDAVLANSMRAPVLARPYWMTTLYQYWLSTACQYQAVLSLYGHAITG